MSGNPLKKLLQHPLAAQVRFEDPGYIRIHHQILRSNPALMDSYEKWYREMLPAYRETEKVPGTLVELGSGVGFLERFIPDVLKTDSIPNPYAARVVDAMNLDFPEESLRAIFMVGVFHHLSSPVKFLERAEKCLHPGGRLVMIEPNNTFPQKILCKLLDHYEYFDDTPSDWETPDAGKMERANLAKAWMVFIRDAERFQSMFPRLRIKAIRYHTYAAYLLSGGMSFRPMLPGPLLPLINGLDRLISPFGKRCSVNMTIDIEKV